jgi:uncharacterized protein (TIGR00369 family)
MAEAVFDFLSANVGAPPLHRWLKPELVSVDESSGGVELRLPVRAEFRRDSTRPEIHGGILAMLADIAGHAAVAARLRHGVPTVDLRIDYLRMAAGDFLSACATPVKVGRTLAVVDIRITDDQARLVAVGRGTYLTREA